MHLRNLFQICFSNFFSITVILILLSFSACNKDLENDEVIDNSQIDNLGITSREEVQDDEFTILGKAKTIPCSVENMKNAYESLKRNPTSARYPEGEYAIETTHLYLRFKPTDSIQYENLVSDSILAVSDEPFEYEILNEGSFYQDPSLKESDFTYYYSVMPKDYRIPFEITYENLNELHFTKEDKISDEPTEKQIQELEFYDNLNTEALKISDNIDDEEKAELIYFISDPSEEITWKEAQDKGIDMSRLMVNFIKSNEESRLFRRRKWRPSGTVTVFEDAINQNLGVAGARIRVRKWGWLVIKRATTNTSGYFQTSRTRTKRVKYACYFKHRPNFVVKAGTWFWNARDRGHRTHKRSAWSRNYTFGRRQLYAFVQNAAYDYYYRIASQYRISRPKDGMKISAKYNLCGSSQHRPAILTLLPISRIRITRKTKNCSYRGSDGVYATVVHELTHAGHQRMDSGMFSIFHSGSCNRAVLIESWAEGVETIVTNDRYSNLDTNYLNIANDNIGWNFARQRDRATEMNEYTPIVADLVDDYNQASQYSFLNPDPPIDRVQGYTLSQIQNALNNSRDINTWEYKLMVNYFNPTEHRLSELFDYVRFVRNNNLSSPCY
jgi:hypothetical protein